MFGLWGGAAFFLLIPFPRFNNRPRGERPLEAVWSGGRVFAQICKASTTCISALFTPLALSLDSAAATSSPLNYFSSPAQGRDQRSNPQSKFSAGPLSFCSSAPCKKFPLNSKTHGDDSHRPNIAAPPRRAILDRGRGRRGARRRGESRQAGVDRGAPKKASLRSRSRLPRRSMRFATRRTKYTCSIHLRTPCSRESELVACKTLAKRKPHNSGHLI